MQSSICMQTNGFYCVVYTPIALDNSNNVLMAFSQFSCFIPYQMHVLAFKNQHHTF